MPLLTASRQGSVQVKVAMCSKLDGALNAAVTRGDCCHMQLVVDTAAVSC